MKINIEIKGSRMPTYDGRMIIGPLTLAFSTYYFFITGAKNKIDGDEVIFDKIKELLSGWIKFIERLRPGDVVVLPYNMEDEYADVIVVHGMEGNEVGIGVGQSSIPGVSVNIKDKLDWFVKNVVRPAERGTAPVILNKKEFLDALKRFVSE